MANNASVEIPMGSKGISRRDFLKLCWAGAAGCVTAYVAYKYDLILSGLLGTEYEGYTEQAKKYIKERYGLDIIVGVPVNAERANITGNIPNAYELSNGLSLIIEELTKYPPALLKNNGVKAIRFLSNAKKNGKSLGGFVSEFSEGISTLCYTAEPFGLHREFYREAFHHELFHLLDANDGGYNPDDEQWRSFHDCDKCQAYREVDGLDDINRATPKSNAADWFISEYGQRNPAEDRAEFASALMRSYAHRKILKRIEEEKDKYAKKILRAKYETTKQYYLKWSKGLMNENYWRDLIGGEIQENYFSSRPQGG